MLNSPLQLESFHFRKLEVTWIDLPASELSKDPNVTLALECSNTLGYNIFGHKDDESRWLMAAKVGFAHKFKGEPAGYQIQAEVLGQFVNMGNIDVPPDRREFWLRGTAFSLLMGTLRGCIANATAMGLGGVFIIPSFVITDAVKEIETIRAESQNALKKNPVGTRAVSPAKSD